MADVILSPQQQHVVDFVRDGTGSAFVEAVAGAGKTFTLLQALSVTSGDVAFAAYNKKIADEIKTKIAKMNCGNRVRVGTFHSFGLGTWRRIHPNVKCGPEAADRKAKLTVDRLSLDRNISSLVLKLISLAKQRALGLYGSIDDTSKWYDIVDHFDLTYELEDDTLLPLVVEKAIEGIKYHREISDTLIDFDDMIYMPVVTGSKVWTNNFVFVDEAQDTNPARRAYVRKMLGHRGRAIFVGDRHQAIYGFTGADNDAVDLIINEFKCKTLPLTVTYRCPKKVVEKARSVVNHIVAHVSAPEGEVETMWLDDFFKQGELAKMNLTSNDAILCRKTKPLIDMAFALLRNNIPCHVEGRDIGASLETLLNKFASAKTLDGLLSRLEAHSDSQFQKLTAKNKQPQAEALKDRIETVLAIAQQCKTIDELRASIRRMFVDETTGTSRPTLTLSTVHKSKGREWPRVFILGANLWMPGPWAKQDWEIEQEFNLMYVAYTRAQERLVFVNVTNKQPNK